MRVATAAALASAQKSDRNHQALPSRNLEPATSRTTTFDQSATETTGGAPQN